MCVCVWVWSKSVVNTVSVYGMVCICVCVRDSTIYKRDRWSGKESWGNEKWPIQCFSHPFSKWCMLWCLIPKWTDTLHKNQHLFLWNTLQVDTFLRLRKGNNSPSRRCASFDVLFYFLLYSSLAFFLLSTAGQVGTLSDARFPQINLISFFPVPLLQPSDLSPTSASLQSFIPIAKEKFSVPLRDNYQTVKLPHSSRWVITFPPSLLFFFFFLQWNETISF